MKGKQRSNRDFVSPKSLYSVRSAYIMRECMRTMSETTCGLWVKFPLHITPKSFATESVFQVRTKKHKTRSFICKVKLNFLRDSKQFNCDTGLAVFVSFLKTQTVHGFNNMLNGRVETGFQVVKIRRLWRFWYQETGVFPLWHSGTLMGKFFPKKQPRKELTDSVVPTKSL